MLNDEQLKKVPIVQEKHMRCRELSQININIVYFLL